MDLNELEDNCHMLFDWIQSRIELLKKEIAALDAGMSLSTRNLTVLTDLYKIMYVLGIYRMAFTAWNSSGLSLISHLETSAH